MRPIAYRIDQVSKMLNISEASVRRELAEGHLAGIKIRGAVRVPGKNLADYIEGLRHEWSEAFGFISEDSRDMQDS